MSRLVCILAILCCAASVLAERVVRVPHRGRVVLEAYAERGIDILGRASDGDWILFASESDIEWIRGIGTRVTEVDDLVQKLDFDENMGDYHTVAEMQSRIAELQAQYSDILSTGEFGRSVEGRPLWLLEISDNPGVDEGEPEVLLLGCQHSRELMAAEIPFRFVEYLLEHYDDDTRVRRLVDTRRVFVAPLMNPDGRIYVEQQRNSSWAGWWRKNRRDNGDGTIGVDLNRNFSYVWGYDDIGSNPRSSSLTYRGPQPFSEPETQAIRDFCAQRSIRLGFNYHSFGNLLLYPWGYDYLDSEDHEMFVALAEELVSDNGYRPGNPKAGTIYRTNGGTCDWAYGATEKAPFPMFTVEVGAFEDGGFGPSDALIGPFFDRLLQMNLELLEYADEPRRVLGPNPPRLEPVRDWESPTVRLSWESEETVALNEAVRWEIEELRELGHRDVENVNYNQPFWDADGFGILNEGLGNSAAYRSYGRNNGNTTLTTKWPYRVTRATQSFHCRMRYDVENGFDYVYFQASLDGVSWQNVAGNLGSDEDPNGANLGHGITGSSGSAWKSAEFWLNDWVGQTLFLRFAYVTDAQDVGAGVWIDDLGPVPEAESRRVFESSVSELAVDLLEGGRFSYRVRGIDAAGDVGRWSTILDLRADPVLNYIEVPVAQSALRAVSPNPFNPATTIEYEIADARAGSVQMLLVDARGRVLRDLVGAPRFGGRYRVQFDGRDAQGDQLANGVYHLLLRVDGSDVDVRKLTLLK